MRVITPEFQVWKAGHPKTVVIYAKMCRGEMTRFIVKNRLECPEELKSFLGRASSGMRYAVRRMYGIFC